MSDDGFVNVAPKRGGRPPMVGCVSFMQQAATFSGDLSDGLPGRATWQWNRNGMLRARFAEDGALRAYGVGRSSGIALSAVGLYTEIGSRLSGRYPARRDGNDVYIDISGESR